MIQEYNTVQKNPNKVEIRFASCYPNIYKSAMSSLGYQILYDYLNTREDIFCERVIYPQVKSIETRSTLKTFNIISFSLQYEEDYIKMIDMLKRSNIPLKKKNRKKDDPLIIAGGPCATSNPLPISEFIDLFVIGDAECILDDFIDVFKDTKNPRADIYDFLEIPGIYMPGHKVKIQKIKSMKEAYRPIYQIVTKTDNPKYQPAFKDSFLLEVSRGCSRGCRFCMAGCMYKPRRETKIKDLIEIAHKTRQVTGQNKIALIGGAVSDYSKIEDLCQQLYEDKFKIATPSLRIETVTPELIEILKTSGLKTITLAPESIQKLRYSMNKPITDYDIINTIDYAMKLKLKVKLYLLIGIPQETKNDLLELVNFLEK